MFARQKPDFFSSLLNPGMYGRPPRGKVLFSVFGDWSGAGMYTAYECGRFHAAGLDVVRRSVPIQVRALCAHCP